MKNVILIVLVLANTQVCFTQVTYIFSHGLHCNDSQAKKYRSITTKSSSTSWLINDPYLSFNYPDADKFGFCPSKTSLAQKNEIETLTKIYKEARKKSDEIVLVGMSRGAAAILSFAGFQKPSKIKAIIAESPFDSIQNVLTYKLKKEKVGWIPQYLIATAPSLVFNQYDYLQQTPLDLVEHIDKDMPILIIASIEDAIVPAKNSAELYIKLKESHHNHAYFLLLYSGKHGALVSGLDQERYLAVSHAFYKKYNLPYDAPFAQKGDPLLLECQPSAKQIKEALEIK